MSCVLSQWKTFERTLEVERNCKPKTGKSSNLRLDIVDPATDLTTFVYSSTVNVDKLNLVPMTRLDCRNALPANIITYPEPEYLVAGSPSEYNITRAMIMLEDNEIVKLGRNDLTISNGVQYLESCVKSLLSQTLHM